MLLACARAAEIMPTVPTGIGVGVGCGNVPVKNNANHILFQKAKYMYLYTIPPVWSIYTLNPEEKVQL